ncbi:hypothetical protein [Crocosphaera sp.]|uniref:hypothetical protein n=1 Tax=Crocosphaera sp. TaxID=2729996 RepID=UPI003F246A06|nr:hypothetical protein [Crocosphaera sp.]
MRSNVKIPQQINFKINQWFMQPEPNAAGSLGIFRILFCLFYLWHLSTQFFDHLSGLPAVHWHYNLYLLRYFFPGLGEPLPIVFFNVLESSLVFALFILLFGYKTRIATFFVLVLGSLIEAFHTATDAEHGTVLMAFYIPFFMVINNCWGKTYSVDSFIEYRKNGISVSPSESHWIYFLPARSILVMISALFLSSAIFKVSFNGQWLVYRELIANLVLDKNVNAAISGLPLNPLAPFISQTPLLYEGMRIGTLLFEGFFFLSLFSRTLRGFFVSLALLFHSFNAIWLTVTFTPVMIGYGLFINWQTLKEFVLFKKAKNNFISNLNPQFFIFGVLFVSILASVLWSQDIGIQGLFNLDGLINVSTIWYPVFPFSLCWFMMTLVKIFQGKLLAQNS